jgi:hypothetical protein
VSTKHALVAQYDAEGGPREKGTDSAGNKFGPTPSGNFVIAYCHKHHDSTLYPAWSTLAWGTPLRENGGDVEYQENGKWKSLTELWNKKNVGKGSIYTHSDTVAEVKRRHDELYASASIPKTWVFNDFGHMTCYYFDDVKGDGAFDPKTERVRSTYLHTTPDDEATAARYPKGTIVLHKSHGCIHLAPKDIDEMVAHKYLKRGNHIIVHTYLDAPPKMTIEKGDPPYQLHFYPLAGLIQVRGLHHARKHAK